MSEQEKRTQLAEWIDTHVIAEALLDELLDAGIEPSVENGKNLWLDILENELSDAIKSSIRYCPLFNLN